MIGYISVWIYRNKKYMILVTQAVGEELSEKHAHDLAKAYFGKDHSVLTWITTNEATVPRLIDFAKAQAREATCTSLEFTPPTTKKDLWRAEIVNHSDCKCIVL